MSDLIERLERASGPDRALDWEIAEYLGEVPKHSVREVGVDYDWYRAPGEFTLWKALDSEGRSMTHWSPRTYTASMDAAISLVPAEWMWDVASSGAAWVMPDHDLDGQIVIGGIQSPAIALVIAALKARQAA